MHPFLRDDSHFIANLQARQTGKTFNGMAKLLHITLTHRNALAIVTAPKYDQTKNIAFKHLHDHLLRLKAHDPQLYRTIIGDEGLLHTLIRLRNGSTILAESPIPETIRGHTATAVYIMEANFIRDDMDLYTALLFTLNTTNGYLIAESTPWNTDSLFHRIYHDQAYNNFSRHTVPYTAAIHPDGPLTPPIIDMIQTQLQGDQHRWRREMLCEWTEDQNTWLPTSLITLAQDSELEYQKETDPLSGDFHIGLDLGKHRDHSVAAVLQRDAEGLHLTHLHAFPLETSYAAVIGYIKQLQDNWHRVNTVQVDKTGVGDYIVEDMQRGGIHNVEGITFTEQTKEALATALKESMRRATCPRCHTPHTIDTEGDNPHTKCPTCGTTLRPHLHIPYDRQLIQELNTERYELAKTGRIHYNHPEGTHDDRFWALALATHAATRDTPKHAPRAKTLTPT